MAETLSQRRWAENEVVFKNANEAIQNELKNLKKSLDGENNGSLINDIDMPLHFVCECADENCRKRISLKPSEYEQLHQNSSQFIIVPGHNIPEVEQIVSQTDKYVVVQKYITPPRPPKGLNATSIDFSNGQ